MASSGSVKGRVLSRPALDLVLPDFAAERIAVDAEDVRRLGQAPGRADQDPDDEALLEFANGVVELHALVDHLFDKLFEPLGYHHHTSGARGHSSSRPMRRRKASTYLALVCITTSSGSEGTGGCLFQRMRSR